MEKMMLYLLGFLLATAVSIEARTLKLEEEPQYYNPSVLKVNGTYYQVAYITDITDGIYPIHTSTDLLEWTPAGYVFDAKNMPAWADEASFVSPGIHQVGSNFVVYFAAYNLTTTLWHIGAASAPSPLGPYTPLDEPIVSLPHQHSYYPSIINDGDKLYLVWSNSLYGINARELNADGVSFASEETTTLIKPSMVWEAVAAYIPRHVQRGNYHYLMYTVGACHGVGVARSTDALGPYEKLPHAVVVPTSKYDCPRAASIVKDVDDKSDVFFFNAQINDLWSVQLAPVTWDDEDWPTVAEF